jgi:hypothetical protein
VGLHNYRGRNHSNCFLGREAVDWLSHWIVQHEIAHYTGSTSSSTRRKEAVAIGRAMVTSGWMHHIEAAHTFNDGGLQIGRAHV